MSVKIGKLNRKYFALPAMATPADQGIWITTPDVDHEGDRIMPEGADLSAYKDNRPVLWLHDAYGNTDSAGIPIGTSGVLDVMPGKGIRAQGIDWLTGDIFADRVKNAWDQGKIRAASIGFIPTEAVPNVHGGYDIKRWTLIEWSLVPVPANPSAVRGGLAMAVKALGVEIDPALLSGPNKGRRSRATGDDPLRWNRALSKVFDVTRERYEPATAEYALVSKYLDTEVRHLYVTSDSVPSARMGSFLSAMNELLIAWQVDDVRNLTRDGKEAPPVHDIIQLNSKLSNSFLVDGIRFMHSRRKQPKARIVVKCEPDWWGLTVTAYAHHEQAHEAMGFLAATWARAMELNYLKGEAFSLSGDFLDRGGETWGDLFLAEKNEAPLIRVTTLLNERGKAMENRGVILLGPPGTGKTLAGRVMMNEAKCTFIWLSARDFYRMGAFGGLEYAFELARECAPSILFVEDVDNWIGDRTIDLLKTQMDGIAQYKGVVTVITTNHPETFPAALIDRPGRFHDVLKLDLPDADTRRRMLQAWLPGMTAADLVKVIEATEGYSGAHVRELVRFAGLISGEEGLDTSTALDRAMEKLREQRETITQAQLTDSRYRPTKAISDALAKSQTPRVRILRTGGTSMLGDEDVQAMRESVEETNQRVIGLETSVRDLSTALLSGKVAGGVGGVLGAREHLAAAAADLAGAATIEGRPELTDAARELAECAKRLGAAPRPEVKPDAKAAILKAFSRD